MTKPDVIASAEPVVSGNSVGPAYLARRDRVVVAGGLASIAILAWIYLVLAAREMSGAMMMPRMQEWAVVDLLLLFVMWAVMMVAMMLPSAFPMIATFTSVQRRRREHQRPYTSTMMFVLGYLLVWTGYAAAAAVAQFALHRAALLSPMMISASVGLGAAILISAGLYQVTPLKHRCLAKCRSPLGFLAAEWREGPQGALRMGVRHGAYCVGCCWILMALLFVGGVMNLLWVAAIAGFVLLEKIIPLGKWGGVASGGILVGWGVWVLARTAG